jgi:predicted HTH transcriptional regulator
MDIFMPSEEDLLKRMRRTEDHFTERKVSNDTKDIIKTLVAFGNSTPPSASAVLYLCVYDCGEIEHPQPDLDVLQKRYQKEVQKVYPPLQTIAVVLQENDRQALAIVVPHSPNRPHFGGPSWVRVGSISEPATIQQYEQLIASRHSKASLILQYKDKVVSVLYVRRVGTSVSETPWSQIIRVIDCNPFYVTVQPEGAGKHSFELEVISLSYDNEQDRLMLKIKQ